MRFHDFFPPSPSILLGKHKILFFPLHLRVSTKEARSHMHVLGKTGSGKSYFLAGLFLSFFKAGLPATLIDPHGDLAEFILAQLSAQGELTTLNQREKLIYLDIPQALAQNKFLPFNYLLQPYDEHTMAELVAEAFKRAWPELAHGAPTFENILKHSVIVLKQNNLPLTALADLLTDRNLQDALLQKVSDPQVVRFFIARMAQWGKEAPLFKESTLNRADLLTLSPVLRYSLGHAKNNLNFRKIIDEGKSVIINLSLPSPDSRRLFGCLLTVGMETAALSRSNVASHLRQTSHHLIIDEFSQFMAQSEESLTRMLSETRKYNLFCVMAHQNWSQASEQLKGALQNVGIEVILKSGRADAEYSSKLLGSVNPLEIKHVVENEEVEQKSHPTYFPLQEQWEKQVQQIQQLRTGEAFVRLPNDSVYRIKTPTLQDIQTNNYRLQKLQEYYLDKYFTTPETSYRHVHSLFSRFEERTITRRSTL